MYSNLAAPSLDRFSSRNSTCMTRAGDPSCRVQLQLSVHFGFPACGDGEPEDALPVGDAPSVGNDAVVPGSAVAVAATGTSILIAR